MTQKQYGQALACLIACMPGLPGSFAIWAGIIGSSLGMILVGCFFLAIAGVLYIEVAKVVESEKSNK